MHLTSLNCRGRTGVLNTGVSHLKDGVFCHASICVVLDADMFVQLQAVHDVLNDILSLISYQGLAAAGYQDI